VAPRKASQKKLDRQAAELRQDRLAYVGTLASGLAHEIRTPLNAIQMNIDLLAEDLDAVAEPHREAFARRVERIRAETRSLRGALDAFLSFARPPKLQLTPLDLNLYLAELIEFVEPEAAARHIRIKTDFRKDLFPVPVDPQQFGQVMMNLLANAREAVGEHGAITVRTRETEDTVEVEVEDDGGGVPPDKEARVFDLFFSTKEQGTGLGLGIARRIVEEHGGQIELDNHPGRGARFVVRLPKVKILEFVPGQAPAAGAPGRGGAPAEE